MKTTESKNLDRYKRLIEISKDLASTLELDPLLNRIIYAARDISEAQAASILLYDPLVRQLYFQVATNMDPLMRGLQVPMDSIAGWVLTHRQAVRIADVSKDDRHFKSVAEKLSYDTHSLIGVPLITKDKVIGVLEVINKEKGEFNETDEDLLTVIGAQAAIAIENTRLFQQSDLIAEFVHELRTPLASLSTATYLLLRPEISREQAQQITTNLHSETIRLNSLASSFLDLARLESGRVQFQKSTFPIRPLFEECKTIMQSKADETCVLIALDVPEDMPEVDGDRDKIKQVLLNLISNAIKYNRTGGKVLVGSSVTPKSWQINVSDTGHGIPDESLPNLFQKFYRVKGMETKVGGTGLGLSICKGIIQGHGGRIEVKSQVGVGTTFVAIIPRK
ncbi:MAG TPA: GAF domain-containing sensor histidine kinase [Anaerolineales bacterium]|jgi:signal transduction histidine kinase